MQKLHEMNLRQLRTFVAIADAGGVGRAGTRLNLSQPAASRQIHALERALGVALFDRIGRRVRLTADGEDLLRHCRRLLSDADAIGARARDLGGGHAGTLRVGATPQMMETVLATFLPRYRRHHTGIEVQLVEDGGVNLPGLLANGEVQVAIMPAEHARFHGRLLGPMHVLAVFSALRPRRRGAVLEVAALADEPLLALRPEFGTRVWFDTACHVARIRPRVLLESAAPQALIALAVANYGVAVVPSTVQMPRRGVHVLPLVHRAAAIGRWAVVSWDTRRFLPPYAEAFVHELQAHCRTAFPGRDLIRRAPAIPKPRAQDE